MMGLMGFAWIVMARFLKNGLNHSLIQLVVSHAKRLLRKIENSSRSFDMVVPTYSHASPRLHRAGRMSGGAKKGGPVTRYRSKSFSVASAKKGGPVTP